MPPIRSWAGSCIWATLDRRAAIQDRAVQSDKFIDPRAVILEQVTRQFGQVCRRHTVEKRVADLAVVVPRPVCKPIERREVVEEVECQCS